MTAIDERVVLDIDLDAQVPCSWTNCQEDPTQVAIMACEVGSTHDLPLCDEHLAKTAAWYRKLEWFLGIGLEIESVPHQICLPHRSPVRMRGSRPL